MHQKYKRPSIYQYKQIRSYKIGEAGILANTDNQIKIYYESYLLL